MKIVIRPAAANDAQDIHQMRQHPDVMRNMLATPGEPLSSVQEYLATQGFNNHIFVAEIMMDGGQKKVVGSAGLHIETSLRRRHSAGVAVMVHADYHRQGIGQVLMGTLLDLADQFLMLKRVELTVFVDNEKAIALYKKMGFEVEGTKRCAVVRNGVFADEYMMARVR